MKFIDIDFDKFEKLASSKYIICFGTLEDLHILIEKYGKDWIDRINFFVNNTPENFKDGFYFEGFRWKVYSPEHICNHNDCIVLVAPYYSDRILPICEQLKSMNLPDSIICCSLELITKKINDNFSIPSGPQKIEKTIHSFWFSKETKPQKYKDCIDSWKKYCPDYKIIEWNSDTYDVTKNKYMLKAYEKRMWAFVSDYARMDIIYNYGGIYFDMDVELLRNIDPILNVNAFFSIDNSGFVDLGSGFGAVKEHYLIKKLLDSYKDLDFIYENNKVDFSITIPQPTVLLPLFMEFGYKQELKSQIINDVVFFSPNYFKVAPDFEHDRRLIRGNEFGIHWHNAGWFDEETRKKDAYWRDNLNYLSKIFCGQLSY